MQTIVIYEDEARAFATSKTSPALILRNDRGMLRIGAEPDSVFDISKGMDGLLREGPTDRKGADLIIAKEDEQFQVAVPASVGRTCVYLYEIDGRFRIIGGAAIVSEIVGQGLAKLIEASPDDNDD